MKHWEKLVACITMVMLLFALAACGGGGSSAPSSASPASAGSAAGSAGSPAAEATGSHSLSILAPDPNNPVIRWEDREEYAVYQSLLEMLARDGITLDVEMVPAEQYEVVIQTRMSAASQLPDIANVSALDNPTVLSLANQGVVQPLSGLIDQYSNGNIDNMYSEVYTPAYPLVKTAEGEMYWFTNLHMATYQGKPAGTGLTMMMRQDWLDMVNMEMPTTLEEYDAALQAFRDEDVNGTGMADEIVFVDVKTFGNAMAQWFGLGNDLVYADPESRTINSPWYQDGVKEYFAYVQGLTQKGFLDSSVIGSEDLANQRVAENKVASRYAYGTARWLDAEVSSSDTALYLPMMPVRALESVDPLAIMESAELVWDKYVITQACEDVEGAIKLFDLVYSDEYANLCAWGVEGEGFEVVDGVNTSLLVGDLATNEQRAAARVSTGSPLWGGILPRVQLMNKESELKDETRPAVQRDYMIDIIDYTPWVPMMMDNYLAMPTDEETETINSLTTGLTTYSEELCVKLCLGQASLDDWDSYMAEFEVLGLKDLITAQQSRMDRFYELMG